MAEARSLPYAEATMLVESVPPSSRRSRPRISIVRTRTAPQDGATTLALQLAVIRANHRLDVLALVDRDGTLLSSAGDGHAAAELAEIAARAAREPAERRKELLPRVGVFVETVTHGDRTWILAATSTDPMRNVRAIVASIRDVLPTLAAVTTSAAHEEEDDDFEAAFDDAFVDAWDGDDRFPDLASLAG